MQKEEFLTLLRIHEDYITGLLQLQNSLKILTSSLDGTLVCVDLTDFEPKKVIDLEVPIRCLTADASVVVLLSATNTLTFLSVTDNYEVGCCN